MPLFLAMLRANEIAYLLVSVITVNLDLALFLTTQPFPRGRTYSIIPIDDAFLFTGRVDILFALVFDDAIFSGEETTFEVLVVICATFLFTFIKLKN